MRARPLPDTLPAVGCLLLLAFAPAGAQTVGFEAGVASVNGLEDSVVPAFGVSLFAPLSERVSGSLTYSQWTGDPEAPAGNATGPLAGNRTLGAMAFARLFGERGPAAWLGAGVGLVEQEVTRNGDLEREWEEAFLVGGLLSQPVSDFLSLYARGDLGFPFSGGDAGWGSVRLGLAARLY